MQAQLVTLLASLRLSHKNVAQLVNSQFVLDLRALSSCGVLGLCWVLIFPLSLPRLYLIRELQARALRYGITPTSFATAGWRPGEKSMKLDPKLSKEYFAVI